MLLTSGLTFLDNATQIRLINEAKRYDDFNAFCDDIGYEAWMDNFCESSDEITEREARNINNTLMEAWRKAGK